MLQRLCTYTCPNGHRQTSILVGDLVAEKIACCEQTAHLHQVDDWDRIEAGCLDDVLNFMFLDEV